MSRLTTDPGLLALGVACFAAAVAIAVLGTRLERRTRRRHTASPRPPRPPRQPDDPPTSAYGFSIVSATRKGLLAGDIAARVMRGTSDDYTPVWPPRQEMPR